MLLCLQCANALSLAWSWAWLKAYVINDIDMFHIGFVSRCNLIKVFSLCLILIYCLYNTKSFFKKIVKLRETHVF